MESLIPVLVALTLFAILAAFAARPLLASRNNTTGGAALEPPSPEDELADLLFRRDALLAALHDLQLDLEMGKISREDFDRLNAHYRAEAAQVLKKLDELQEGRPEGSPADAEALLDEWIEAAVRKARQTGTASAHPSATSPTP